MATAGKSVKGRGAADQPANRFLRNSYGIVHPEGIDEPLDDARPTRYLLEEPRTIVNRVNSPDLPFVYSLNPYQGCEHGCAYCYARPTHEYWGYSAGLDFEQVILVKRNAPELLRQKLMSQRWEAHPISISGATDPYQPKERVEGLTRRLLEVALEFKQPVSLITKNALVLRDKDLLAELAIQGLASVAISITTLNEDLRRIMEPRTSTAANRLRAITELRAAGVPVMAMLAPVIPALNEPEIPELIKAAAAAGALTASYTVLRTNGAVRPIFEAWLRSHFPDRAEKVLAQTRELHGGDVSDSVAGRRMRGQGAYATSINRMFSVLRLRHFGDSGMPALRCDLFKRPPQGQLGLFDYPGA
ncbi:MAG: PA0069 family radical SAM protein [Flavobacteriales bacterium]|jgi:DNA repair photolyase|nr:PA0069 family radical SAM protein [Flavobacteriales bacterium]